MKTKRVGLVALAAAVVVTSVAAAAPDIRTRQADGGELRNLTRNPAEDGHPAWSPDGRTIAFASNRDGLGRAPDSRRPGDVFIMSPDGTGQQNLTLSPRRYDGGQSWSPDGRRIAFVSTRHPLGIHVMNADGSGERNLTRTSGYFFAGFAWSPDGRRIAFHGDPQGGQVSFVINADGSGERRLPVRALVAAWSPGRKIALVSNPDGNGEIYVMNADGSGQRNLTRNSAHEGDPVWSPDGRRMAFVSDRDGNGEIYVMDADGSGQRRLTHDAASDFGPVWSPDGRRIAFETNRDGNSEVYVMNAGAGSGAVRGRVVIECVGRMRFGPPGPAHGRCTIAGAITDQGWFKDDAVRVVHPHGRTFRSAKGTIEMSVYEERGHWRIIGGTGAYAGLRGGGREALVLSPPGGISFTMTGTVSR